MSNMSVDSKSALTSDELTILTNPTKKRYLTPAVEEIFFCEGDIVTWSIPSVNVDSDGDGEEDETNDNGTPFIYW